MKCENCNETSVEYQDWKRVHKCQANYAGSAGGMEPKGTLNLFRRSL